MMNLISERMSNPTVTCAPSLVLPSLVHVLLADNKMANISLDVHTFIAENLPKYRFHSSRDYTFLTLGLGVFSISFKRKICDFCHIWDRKVAVVFYIVLYRSLLHLYYAQIKMSSTWLWIPMRQCVFFYIRMIEETFE